MTRAVAFASLLALAAALAGCGKKGDPDYPEGAQVETVVKADGRTVERPKRSSRPFVLDRLLN